MALRLHRHTARTRRRPLRKNLCPEHLILYILYVLAHVLRTTGVVCFLSDQLMHEVTRCTALKHAAHSPAAEKDAGTALGGNV